MNWVKILLLLLVASCFGCIKDDFIDDSQKEELRLTSMVDSIEVGTTFQMEALFINNIGKAQNVGLNWSSSNTDVLSIDQNGLATANMLGRVTIYVSYNNLISEIQVSVGNSTVLTPMEKSGLVATTSSYALSGKFKLKEDGNGLVLEFFDDYNASTALPQLVIYLSNNPNSNGNALEIGDVSIFNGAHSYMIPNVGINDYKYVLYYCKPFAVKVGHGEIL